MFVKNKKEAAPEKKSGEKAAKKKAPEQEPQYYKSATNIQTLNYRVYIMSPLEKILYAVAAFVVGAMVGYLFYGGIGVDEFGNPTTLTYVLNTVSWWAWGRWLRACLCPSATNSCAWHGRTS